EPILPLRCDGEMVPVTVTCRLFMLTAPDEVEASRLRFTAGSRATRTPPPDVPTSPPRALPLAKPTSTEPPEVWASTLPPAFSMRIEPPENAGGKVDAHT